MNCFFCGDAIELEGPSTVWQATSCFTARTRIRGSGRRRDMSDRVVYRYLDVFAHDDCVRKMQRGTLNQEAMNL
jgi:hypothetical protein